MSARSRGITSLINYRILSLTTSKSAFIDANICTTARLGTPDICSASFSSRDCYYSVRRDKSLACENVNWKIRKLTRRFIRILGISKSLSMRGFRISRLANHEHWKYNILRARRAREHLDTKLYYTISCAHEIITPRRKYFRVIRIQ